METCFVHHYFFYAKYVLSVKAQRRMTYSLKSDITSSSVKLYVLSHSMGELQIRNIAQPALCENSDLWWMRYHERVNQHSSFSLKHI